MRKFITAFILVVSLPISCYANSDWIPAQITTPPLVVQIQPTPVYRLVTRVETQLVPNVVLVPVQVQRIGVFGRVIGESVIMQPITIYQWQNVTISSWQPVLP